MNYDFYLRKIGEVTSPQLLMLREHIAAQTLDATTTDWDQNRHIGITGLRFDQRWQGPLTDILGMSEIAALGTFFNYEIDVLQPGGHIKWHTDVTTIGHRCEEMHRVHIPCTGEGEYHFHPHSSPESVTILRMEHGGIYLFNNYVMHRVLNKGSEPRANIMINFDA